MVYRNERTGSGGAALTPEMLAALMQQLKPSASPAEGSFSVSPYGMLPANTGIASNYPAAQSSPQSQQSSSPSGWEGIDRETAFIGPEQQAVSGWDNIDRETAFIGPVQSAMSRRMGKEGQQEAVPYANGNLDAINALMQMAGTMPTPGAGGIDIAAIMKEAAGAARAPFQAEIQSTKGQNQRAKADTGESSKQIRKMYQALSRSNTRAATRESDQSMASAEAIQGMGAESAASLEADNKARLDASATQSAALGSGELAATLAGDINANTSEASRQIVENASLGSTATANRGEAERRFLNRSAGNARLTGTNRAADLFGDLQDYLQGNRDKISSLRGQATAAAGAAKTSASAAAAQSQSDAYEQQYGAQQDMLQNQMALLGMKTDLQQQDFDNNMSTEELGLRMQQFQLDSQPDPEEGPMIPGFDDRMLEALPESDRSALMLQQFLDPASGDILSKLMQNPALRSGFFTNEAGEQVPIGGNALNSEQLMKELGVGSSDPRQQMLLAQIISAMASGNTDLPYGAQR